ncbi:MAG TPA: hypothetical protein VF103_06140 [Polyangiaceae bacterium]
MSEFFARLGTSVTQYRPHAAIVFPGVLFGAGVWLIFQSCPGAAPVTLLALAATCLGILLGFLFGIPRVNSGASGANGVSPGLRVNTNIEQISDWLTKILVGLTLTNLANLPRLFAHLSTYLVSHGLQGAATESALTSVSVFFLVDGFLFGYLATRLYLTGAFMVADPTEVLQRLKPAMAGISVELDVKPDLSPDATAAAREVSKLDLTRLAGADEAALWAKAQLALGNPKKAAEGYAAAVRAAPDRADLRVERAVALERAGEPRDRVLRELDAAYKNAGQNPGARRRAVEGLMVNYLYIPGGYDRVLELGSEHLKTKTGPSARIWMYLAAAWGQKHHELTGDASSEQLLEFRQHALGAARQAIALDPSLKRPIAKMLEGKDEDNDLTDFRDDAEFRALVTKTP